MFQWFQFLSVSVVPKRGITVGMKAMRALMVSTGGDLVGDAKYFTLVHGRRLPPAKFSIIAEHVWLLEKTGASTTFLVFGNDWRVPELWLERYGSLVSDVGFYFLADDGGALEELRT